MEGKGVKAGNKAGGGALRAYNMVGRRRAEGETLNRKTPSPTHFKAKLEKLDKRESTTSLPKKYFSKLRLSY